MSKATLEILGSGGATTIPKPLCNCRVCSEAREKVYPYKRTAPSLFLHGPDILFDTPEEIKYQLERSQIKNIDACFYSHWHPDHTAGIRVWECNKSQRQIPNFVRTTPIYMADYVDATFDVRRGLNEQIDFMAKQGFVEKHVIPEGETVSINGADITPFRLYEDYASGFDIRLNGKKILLIIDESFGWNPPEKYQNYDIVLLPSGVVKHHPISGEQQVADDHPILVREPTFEHTLEMIKKLKAKRLILGHFEEGDRLSHGDWQKVQADLMFKGIHVDIAIDQMKIDL